MHRSTPAGTLHRSYNAGGARCIIDKVDDSKLMQEMSGNFMKGESRKEIESPQNYGFTSAVRDASRGSDGQIHECAEGFSMYLGGNRSFPVCMVMDDRRYRLKNLKTGDVAMYDYLQHQIHFNENGMFVTGRTDKSVKFQLVPPPDQQQQGSGNQKMLKGQLQRYNKQSSQYFKMDKDSHDLVHDQTINYKTVLHSFQSASSSSMLRSASDFLVQIFGNKFTGGLGYFMKQVTAAPPTAAGHVATKGYVDSIFTALGITIPALPTLPMPPLPPGITLPPGFTLPLVEAVKATTLPPPVPTVIDGGTF